MAHVLSGAADAAAPFVSVLMPVRNEVGYLGRSVGSVLAQDYPASRLEVIVADGMSDDGSRERLAAMAAHHEGLRIIDNPARIASTGLNAALSVARGEVIVRVDGHCEIAPDYVRRCVAHLGAGGADGVGGPIRTIGETPIARVIARAMSTRFGVGDSAFRTVSGETRLTDTVAFPAYRRALIDRAGPFDEELVRNQDDEYNYRLRGLGARILLAADVRSRYYSRGTLGSLWRQYLEYGYWKVRVMQKHPQQMRPRQFVPPLFVLSLLAAGAATPFVPGAAPALAAILAAYLGANLSAAAITGPPPGGPAVCLPAAFATMHVAYGLGFLAGLVRFCARWRDRGVTVRSVPTPQPGLDRQGAGRLHGGHQA
jgi:hypothetical protein